ncbi:Stp1/IreP family PP2C-type Ser/Thr phosphatase [Clostridium fallax]|uniref:Protein phosphatase n=1 Tax=Clostridium fallax TaxID=1533 RepID=A0A1M4UU80_9CLOT|nr:Stp1/IreP family PP2C-type Ser/Thr phosphatase [Clostridium fallax]SHE60254.1 protein phosphatase [Clostridium fallax]SQB07211.1 protein phosphatase 2C [Clostridium fallax]
MVGKITDLGNKRELNEDYLDYFKCKDFEVYVIADGMGGHNAGEVASKMAVEGILNFIKSNYGIINNEEILKKSVEFVNDKIYKHSLSSKSLEGMGTTLTACFRTKKELQIANVGDSSCLAIKDDKIEKITKDHSLVQELLDSGSITEEEAKIHPIKNIITRAIGTNSTVNIDIYNYCPKEYDTFILCTDGLTNDVSITEILEAVKSTSDYNKVCRSLVDLAKLRGGKDNISVLIFGGEM